jgi:hypothetical protein
MFDDRTKPTTSAQLTETTDRGAGNGRVADDAGSGRPGAVNGRCGPDGSAGRIGEHSPVGDLLAAARQGDPAAWDALVRRYAPLVRAVTRTYRLRDKDAEDVSQVVWLRLVEHLTRLREPLALPKWIITTARRESQRLTKTLRLTVLMNPLDPRHDFHCHHAEVEAGLLRAEPDAYSGYARRRRCAPSSSHQQQPSRPPPAAGMPRNLCGCHRAAG